MVIDAHLHLWNTERLRCEWLQRPENAAINRTFGFGDFRRDAGHLTVRPHIAATPFPEKILEDKGAGAIRGTCDAAGTRRPGHARGQRKAAARKSVMQ